MKHLFSRPRATDIREVTICQTGKSFPAPGKDSVLNEALAAGVAFPHSCTVGTCGTCKARLLSGKVREISDSAIVLTSQELREGYILTCQSIAKRSLELDVAGMADLPDHELKSVTGSIGSQERLTHDILRMELDLAEPIEYTAGQYAELRFDDLAGPRSYSFADAPCRLRGTAVTFFVRHVPGGEFTDWLFSADRAGAPITIVGPLGNLWLRPAEAPVLCVVGGSGLAPIKAMLEQALDEQCSRDVALVFGARQRRDLYCLDEIEALAEAWPGAFRKYPILSEEPPQSEWSGLRGVVTDVLADLPTGFLATCHVYTCGPPAMIDALEEAVMSVRTDAGFFHADRFVTRRAPSDR